MRNHNSYNTCRRALAEGRGCGRWRTTCSAVLGLGVVWEQRGCCVASPVSTCHRTTAWLLPKGVLLYR
jgi:hypothetical protein